jgi:two-component system, NarL family, response regulator NreC
MPDLLKNIRLLICDDHALVRSGIVKLLEEENWIYLVGEAENGEEMIQKYISLRPDLILADISMPVLSGIDAVKRIKQNYPEAIILFLSMLFDEQYIYCAIKVGASGLLSKNVSKDELLYALSEITLGRKYFGPLYNDKKILEIIKKYDSNSNSSLDTIGVKMTNREEEVLKYVSQGLMSEEIGDKMNLGKRTVDKIRISIMQKFELKSLPALISFAIHYTEYKKNSNITIDF